MSDFQDTQGDEDNEQNDAFERELFPSKPHLSAICTIPENVVELHYSYGYSCRKYFNLCVMDESNLIFISGNLLHFYNVETNLMSFRRSVGGCGIGHLAHNPKTPHLAVGEKGDNPLLIIYEWSSFNIVCVLRHGTKREYTYLNYSPDGDLLLSQGGDPDYMLTIWDWQNATALLRGQSYTQDVINARFSNYVPGHLTTSGFGHIKFWKMAQTFTGLKLKGALGRFGKTEICDIIGFLAMPDEKVVSGCEWGNILLWEDGLIKAEICRRNRLPCHTAPITQFLFKEKELTSIGLDGIIKMWYFETIDQADPPEHDRFIEMEPMFQCEIGCSEAVASIMSMVKKVDRLNDHFWYAQDANGGIWNVDLNVDGANEHPRQLLVCHSGSVVDIATAPCGPYLASLGEDGRLFFYNYETKKLLSTKTFAAKGQSLIWLPRSVVNAGSVLAAGFSDGVVRVLVSSLREFEKSRNGSVEAAMLVQVVKPHIKPITVLSANPKGSVLVSGSEDNTIFVHQILRKNQHVSLVPIGFIEVPNSVTFIDWKPNSKTKVLVSCSSGHALEMSLPEHPQPSKVDSFRLTPMDVVDITFRSVKSQIRRDIALAKIEKTKQEKLERKKVELQKFREENPNVEIDEEDFLEDSEPSEEPEPLYFPPEPNPVLFATYLRADVVWLSMGGYDAGYMYQYRLGQNEPFKSTVIADADDIEIHSFTYNFNKKYLLFGLQNGQIRVNKVNPNDSSDLTDYWLYSMHDNTKGIIPRLCFSYDQHYLFSCGEDGNIFAYSFNVPSDDYPEKIPLPIEIHAHKIYESVSDIDGTAIYSLEENKSKAEQDQHMKLAEDYKQKIKSEVAQLAEKYKKVIDRNHALPEIRRFTENELELHESITADFKTSVDREMDLQTRKLAYDVEKSMLGLSKLKAYFFDYLDSLTTHVIACRSDSFITTFRQRKLLKDFYDARKQVEEQLSPMEDKGRQWQAEQLKETLPLQDSDLHGVDSFLKGLSLSSIEYKHNLKLLKAIERYRARKLKVEKRKREWNELHSKEPDKSIIHPDDLALITEAEQTIGDYRLKTSPDYKVPLESRVNSVQKFEQILNAREKEFVMKHSFNQEVFTLRSRKLSLIQNIHHQRRMLISIHQELSVPRMKAIPELPAVNEELEFPERFLEVKMAHVNKHVEETHDMKEMDVEVMSTDWEQEMLASRVSPDRSVLELPPEEFQKVSQVSMQQLTDLMQLHDSSSVWEVELSRARNMRKMYEQDVILHDAANFIHLFDEDVKRLVASKLELEVDLKFQELYLVQLNEELNVLNIFDGSEKDITSKVFARTAENNETHAKILNLQDRMTEAMSKIEAVKNKLKDIFASFEELTADNLFADFLTKIFTKKYKQPRIAHPVEHKGSEDNSEADESDEDESSIEDTTTDDDDEDYDDENLHAGKFLAKLDESVCPEGLDINVYNQTFILRQQRHETEQQLIDENKNLDNIQKELEVTNISTKSLKEALEQAVEELEVMQRSKQKYLNDLECVVLMRLDSIQLLNNEIYEPSIIKLVLFREALTRLRARPGEIAQETEEEYAKSHQNRRTLHQLHLDYKEMKVQSEKLKEKAQQCMEQKFGRKIDLQELEEAVLRCLVTEMKLSIKDVANEYNLRMKELQEKLRQKKEILSFAMQENTEKLNILTILEEEKNKLDNILELQLLKMEHLSTDKEAEYQQDIQKLKNIVKNQAEQMKHLEEEIRTLTYKSRPKIPAVPYAPITEAETMSADQDANTSPHSQHLPQECPLVQSAGEKKF